MSPDHLTGPQPRRNTQRERRPPPRGSHGHPGREPHPKIKKPMGGRGRGHTPDHAFTVPSPGRQHGLGRPPPPITARVEARAPDTPRSRRYGNLVIAVLGRCLKKRGAYPPFCRTIGGGGLSVHRAGLDRALRPPRIAPQNVPHETCVEFERDSTTCRSCCGIAVVEAAPPASARLAPFIRSKV